MKKKLDEMTLPELWELFKIISEPRKKEWAGWYREEEASLKSFLPESTVLTHIGSTAVKSDFVKEILSLAKKNSQ